MYNNLEAHNIMVILATSSPSSYCPFSLETSVPVNLNNLVAQLAKAPIKAPAIRATGFMSPLGRVKREGWTLC